MARTNLVRTGLLATLVVLVALVAGWLGQVTTAPAVAPAVAAPAGTAPASTTPAGTTPAGTTPASAVQASTTPAAGHHTDPPCFRQAGCGGGLVLGGTAVGPLAAIGAGLVTLALVLVTWRVRPLVAQLADRLVAGRLFRPPRLSF